MQFVHSLFGFQGRIGRGQWWGAVLTWAALYAAVVLATMLFASSWETVRSVGLALPFVALLLIPPSLTRLHDRNKSGVWVLLFIGCPIATLIFGILPLGGEQSASLVFVVVQYVLLAIDVWALVELGFLRGSIGGNQYGPDPVAPKPAHH